MKKVKTIEELEVLITHEDSDKYWEYKQKRAEIYRAQLHLYRGQKSSSSSYIIQKIQESL
jgi:hypothetical protein